MLVKTYVSAVSGIHANAQMSTKQLQVFCKLNSESQQLLKMAMTKLNLSAMVYDRILKVARTIADLEKKINYFRTYC